IEAIAERGQFGGVNRSDGPEIALGLACATLVLNAWRTHANGQSVRAKDLGERHGILEHAPAVMKDQPGHCIFGPAALGQKEAVACHSSTEQPSIQLIMASTSLSRRLPLGGILVPTPPTSSWVLRI